MNKFTIDRTNNYTKHWNYCKKNDIPFVRIIPATKYSKIEYDFFDMLEFYELTKSPLKFMIKFYKNYVEFFDLPKDKISSIGGEKSLIFTVHKEHSEFIANKLFDYLDKFVKENRKKL